MHSANLQLSSLIFTGILGLLTGFLLGSLGAGGSLLALPAFLYAARLPVPVAVATSLIVVGMTSVLGGILAHIRCQRRGCPGAEVSGRVALVMAVCGLMGTQAGVHIAASLTPAIRQGFLVIVLLGAAAALFRNAAASSQSEQNASAPDAPSAPTNGPDARAAVLPGFGVGVLTGILGVGGGFLLVPALRLATGLSVRRAAATSLWIIAANAGFAFAGYARSGISVAWGAAGIFLALSVPGMLLGQWAARAMQTAGLQRGFAALLATIAAWTIWTLMRPFFIP